MTSLVAGVVDALGADICAGRLAPGTALTLEAVQERTGVSRPAAREAMSALATLGLVAPRRRIGFEVADPERWQRLAPEVMRWRLAGPARDAVTAELTALRALVEPAAARAAASAASASDRAEIAARAGALWSAAAGADREAFVAEDRALHTAVLAASGNSLFRALGGLLAESLPPRAPDAAHISLEAARRHLELAEAITAGDGERAAAAAHAIAAADAP
ncbi:FCD domain-containing protein [Microbacterium barkeri]|uniref:FadR/GntR family transcriptional regulator n=1 Tax=Microbacterium barkeri TaxID=33917 RepID=UPI0024AFFF5D|nr:FCD domain-containing protein [Microbacterium barkeri]MDI6943345.1 FCD domain-containing protein [Microbacterium barkeri]